MTDERRTLPGDLLLLLGRIDAKLDASLQRIDAHDARAADHDKRLAELERSRAWVIGAATAVSTIASYLISILKG